MKKSEKKKLCHGCDDNYYNVYEDECWNLDSAKPVDKVEVHISERPPWPCQPKRVLTCYHRPKYVYIDPDDPRVE